MGAKYFNARRCSQWKIEKRGKSWHRSNASGSYLTATLGDEVHAKVQGMQMREAAELDVCAEVGDCSIGDLRVLAHELLSLEGLTLLEHLGSLGRGVVRIYEDGC